MPSTQPRQASPRSSIWSGVAESASKDPSAVFAAHYRGFFTGWTAAERSWADLDSVALERIAVGLAGRKVAMIPTLVLHETLSRLDDPSVLSDPALADVPAAQQQLWDIPGFIARAGWTTADFARFEDPAPIRTFFFVCLPPLGAASRPKRRFKPAADPRLQVRLRMELLVTAGFFSARSAATPQPGTEPSSWEPTPWA